jgi:1,4-alpha-glucan branching enzyme
MAVAFQFVGAYTPLGANLVPGGATFRAWAPRAESLFLLTGPALTASAAPGFAPDPADQFTPLGDGTWGGFLANATDGLEYLFWVDGPGSSGPKRDPYARELTATPAFPGSYCLLRDPEAYPWHDAAWAPPDFSKLVIYQLHVGT